MTKRLLPLLFLCFLSSSSFAAEGGSGGMGAGLRLGAAFPSPGSLSLLVGAEFAFPLLPGFQTLGFIDRVQSGVAVKMDTLQTEATSGSWILGGSLRKILGAGIGVGASTGLHKFSANVRATDGTNTVAYEKSKTTLFVAPLVSFEYGLGAMAITAEVRYLISLGDNPNIFSILPGIRLNF